MTRNNLTYREIISGLLKKRRVIEDIFEVFELQKVIAKKDSVKSEEIVYKYN